MAAAFHLSYKFETETLSEDGRFAGYASVFGLVDSQHDMVLRGAFERTLADRRAQVKLLWQHQPAEPIGIISRMFEDSRGLYIEGKLLLDVGRGREAYSLLKSGAVGGLSIGYVPVDYHLDPDNGVRKLKRVDLFEVSLVTFPANDAARVTVVKSVSL